MEKYFRPERLEADPNSSTATKQWIHWLKTFENFTQALEQQRTSTEAPGPAIDLLNLLTNYVAPQVFEYIAECATY